MHPFVDMPDTARASSIRRGGPRLTTLALCSELTAGRDRPGFVIDLSPTGLRIERPYIAGPTPAEIQVELELPDEDEVLWARGTVRFDEVRDDGRGGLLRRTGIALVSAASRDLNLLRSYVLDRHSAAQRRLEPAAMLLGASCYARA